MFVSFNFCFWSVSVTKSAIIFRQRQYTWFFSFLVILTKTRKTKKGMNRTFIAQEKNASKMTQFCIEWWFLSGLDLKSRTAGIDSFFECLPFNWMKGQQTEPRHKVIHPIQYKHQLFTLASTIDCECFSLFWPPKVHYRAEIGDFLTFMLINAQKLLFCTRFAQESLKEHNQ